MTVAFIFSGCDLHIIKHGFQILFVASVGEFAPVAGELIIWPFHSLYLEASTQQSP